MTTEITVFAVQFVYSPSAQEAMASSDIEYWEPGGDIFEGEEITLYVKTQEDQEALLLAIMEAQSDDA